MSLYFIQKYPKVSVAPEQKINLKNINMPSHSPHKKKGTPSYASLKGSFTIEAAFVMPMFITLMMVAVFFYRVLVVEFKVQQAIDTASRTMAVTLEESDGKLLGEAIAYADLLIAEAKVPAEYINGGILGLNYAKSSAEGNYLDLKVDYKVKFPIGILGKHGVKVSQEARNRKWIGYDPAEGEFGEDEYVYLAQCSEVYHLNPDCTYLHPNIRAVIYSNVASERNEGGAKYYPCLYCHGKNNSGTVYLTEYGRSYHSTIDCSRLNRNIRKELRYEAEKRYPPCSKCGG